MLSTAAPGTQLDESLLWQEYYAAIDCPLKPERPPTLAKAFEAGHVLFLTWKGEKAVGFLSWEERKNLLVLDQVFVAAAFRKPEHAPVVSRTWMQGLIPRGCRLIVEETGLHHQILKDKAWHWDLSPLGFTRGEKILLRRPARRSLPPGTLPTGYVLTDYERGQQENLLSLLARAPDQDLAPVWEEDFWKYLAGKAEQKKIVLRKIVKKGQDYCGYLLVQDDGLVSQLVLAGEHPGLHLHRHLLLFALYYCGLKNIPTSAWVGGQDHAFLENAGGVGLKEVLRFPC